MRHRWTLMILLLSLPLCGAARAEPPRTEDGLGPLRRPEEMSAGGLLLRDSEGLREAPTLSTTVSIEVSGLIARTRISQRFGNPTDAWIEGVYVFPLPERSTVDGLRMRIGERIIEGRVEERARARATYRKAAAEGRKASLVEQERPNIFTTSLANLGPGEEVEVVLTYQEDLRYDRGRFSLRFPMVVAPRYVGGTQRVTGFAGTGWGVNTDQVPDAERLTPPVAAPAAGLDRPVEISVEIDAGFPLVDVESSSHPIRVQARKGDVYSVRLDEGPIQADADFVLGWRPRVGAEPSAALFREHWAGDDYALLMVMPPSSAEATGPRLSRETILVIDTSGSMAGESIVQARAAVRHALGTLRPEDSFNVIRFASDTTSLHPEARPATPAAIADAQAWVDRLEADGGTEMLPALRQALLPSSEGRAVRQVVFITDGSVGGEAALFRVIQQDLGRSRLYPVGIGSAPNTHFMTRAARFGRGQFTYIGRPDEVAEKMTALFDQIDRPVLHDLALDWGDAHVEVWPRRLPDLYAGQPLVVAARLPGDARRVVLTGQREGESIRLELPLAGGQNHEGVARLWARRKVASLMDSLHEGASIDRVSAEVARLGVQHQLVTRWSSLVAVDVTPTAPVDANPETRAVPTKLPRGWKAESVFGPPGPGTPKRSDPDRQLAAAAPSVDQPLPTVQIGRLPQGGSPAALLMIGGSLLLGGACLTHGCGLARKHRADRDGTNSA
mgnify:CR=1 FL=1